MDIIVVHGSPGNGKTTIAAKLHEHFKSPWFEFGWIPEFTKLNPHTSISMKEEEQLSFENVVLVAKNYLKHGYENVILSDFNDVRMLDIPQVFAGSRFVIITLYSEDDEVIKNRILTRDNGNDFKDFEQSINSNQMTKRRKLLPNEYRIRSDNQTPETIVEEILSIFANHQDHGEYQPGDHCRADYFSYITEYREE